MKTFRFLFIVLALMLSINASAHDFEVDGIYYNITTSGHDLTVAVTYRGSYYDSYTNEYSGSIVIPEKVTYYSKEYSVTRIGDSAFEGCYGLTSVTIPNSVTSIGSRAFDGCSGLTSVTIPNSVTSIGSLAFYYCSGLTSVTIPNSVTSIGFSAFYGCSGLTSVTIGNSVTSIGHATFRYCSKLTKIDIPNSVTSIGDYAFQGCSGLTSVTIPNSVTSIGDYAFQGCPGLTDVTIPNSVTSIGEYAFKGCKGLTSVTIPNSVTSIGDYAFNGCSGLTSVTIPNSVTSIGNSAFSGCSGLSSVTIPNSVTSIGNNAFKGCDGLTAVYITDLSAWCKINFINVESNPIFYAHHLYLNGEEITNLVIPDDITNIGYHAFCGCSGLSSVTIPNSVTSIGNVAFRECSGLTSVTIPNSVTSIGSFAFSGCSGLTSVTIGNSVTSIGGSAFKECFGLKSLRFEDGEPTLTLSDNFPNTIDSLYLGRNIAVKSSYFNTGENKLSVLSIGKYVVSLDDKMFNECKNIAKIISYATEPPVAYPLTFTTDIYGKATLSVPGESMEKYRNADVWKKFYKIEEIDNNPDATDQCAAPIITYADGKLQFACETAGAECKYTLTTKDIQTAFITASNNSVDLTACYDITAYAVAEGYKNSEKVTATLYWIDGSDVSTNINQTEMRGVMATCFGGIITVSGLTDGETVMFYNANGALLYAGAAQNGTISYAPSTSGVIIVKIGKTSIKVVK